MLYGNIALDGSIVKTAGVDAGNLKFKGPARIFESQDDAVQGILGGKVAAATSSSSATRGRAAGPGMQEMLYPTSYLKSRGLAKLAPWSQTGDSPAAPRVFDRHDSPEAAEGGAID